MEKFDYRKVLVNGNEYECFRLKTGRVYLTYIENGIKKLYIFEDTMNDGILSKVSYFVTPGQIIVEVVSIDFVDLKTDYVTFTGRVKFGNVISNK